MKHVRLLAIVAITLPILVGCGGTSDPAEVSPSGLAFDPAAPLAPQMKAAIDANDPGLAEQVVAAGYDLGAPLTGDYTALHIAAARDAFDVIPVLLDGGADLEATVMRRTPLMFGAFSAGSKTMTVLLEAGADATASDSASFGVSAIHLAAQGDNVEALETLIDWGIDPDLKDSGHTTPLIWAAFSGSLDAVQYLLTFDVDINWRDDFGDTPFRAASRQGYDEIAAIIEDAGGIE
jgi:ankyrin repeat protein